MACLILELAPDLALEQMASYSVIEFLSEGHFSVITFASQVAFIFMLLYFPEHAILLILFPVSPESRLKEFFAIQVKYLLSLDLDGHFVHYSYL